MMDPMTVLALLRAGTATVKALAPLVDQAREVFGSDDAAEIQGAANELAAANDQLHERLQTALAAAAKR